MARGRKRKQTNNKSLQNILKKLQKRLLKTVSRWVDDYREKVKFYFSRLQGFVGSYSERIVSNSEKVKLILRVVYKLVKSIIFSLFISLVLYPKFLDIGFIKWFLDSQDKRLLVGITALVTFVLVSTWKRTSDFWWRYKNTYEITVSKFTYVDFVFSAIYFSVITILIWHPKTEISSEVSFFWVFNFIIIILYFLTSYVFSRPKSTKNAISRNVDSEISDEPINFIDEDLLNRGKFVKGLYEEIQKLDLIDSFVFGIHGDWGDGKTSVINLLNNRIEEEGKFIVVNFKPWDFKDEDAILNAFFASLEKSLGEKYTFPSLKKLFVKYQKLISSGLSNTGLKLDFDFERETIDEIRERIEGYIESTGKKLLIIIDEIDRLQPEEILMLFKLVRSNSKFKNSIFVLSLDENKTTEKLGTNGKEYLEKIVQKPISLPKIEQTFLDKFVLFSEHKIPQNTIEEIPHLAIGTAISISGYIKKVSENRVKIQSILDGDGSSVYVYSNNLGHPNYSEGTKVFVEGQIGDKGISLDAPESRMAAFKLSRIDLLFERMLREEKITTKQIAYFDKEFSFLYRTQISKLIGNFRDAKRFLNSLYSSFPAIASEVSPFDFVLLEIIKVFNHELYDEIFKHWWFYVDERSEGDTFNNPFVGTFSSDKGKTQEAILKHINDYFEEDKKIKSPEVFRAILNTLFPKLGRDSSISGEDRLNKRIFTTSFLKYFTLEVTSTELSDVFFKNEIAIWDKEKTEPVILSTFDKLRQKNKLVEFLDKLRRIFVDEMSIKSVDLLLRTIYKNTKTLSKKEIGDIWESEYDKALVLMLKILNSKVDKADIQKWMEEIVEKSPDLLFAVDMVLLTKKERGGDLFAIYDNSDNPTLRTKLSKRLESYYIKGKRSVYSETKNGWTRVLYQWSSNWNDIKSPNMGKVGRYIVSIFKNDPVGLVEFIKSLHSGFPGKEWEMNINEYKGVYDLDRISKLANKFKNDERLNDLQKNILKKFIELQKSSLSKIVAD